MHRCPPPQVLPIVGDVVLVREADYFLPLSALAKVSGLSVRKLRALLADPVAPLAHYRPGGKILVRWTEFLAYMEQFRARPVRDVDSMVQEIVKDLKGKPTRPLKQKRPQPAGPRA